MPQLRWIVKIENIGQPQVPTLQNTLQANVARSMIPPAAESNFQVRLGRQSELRQYLMGTRLERAPLVVMALV